jgi:predicted enzyme related to lactoylglutathione lyase
MATVSTIRSNEFTDRKSAAKVDFKFEVVVIPVSDVDRAKEFYTRLRGASTSTPVTRKTIA